MIISRNARSRTFFLFVVFSVWVTVIIAFLIKIQIFNYEKYLGKIRSQSSRIFSLLPKRGTIYDAHGDILAMSVKAQSVFLSNKDTDDSLQLYRKLSAVINLDMEEKKNIIRRIRNGDKFIWIKRKLDESEYKKLEPLQTPINGKSRIDFVEEYKRIYPQHETACHILGGVGMDEQGLFGVEYSLESILMGKGGKVEADVDARRKIFKLNYLETPKPGKDIYLTIDSSIQFFIEKELKQTVNQFQAKGGVVIVMNSQTGDILAMASYPVYSPDSMKHTSKNVLKNKAISFLYEPGSTFKIILAAAALEQNVCYPQQVFDCGNGKFQIKDRTITDHHPFDRLSFEDVLIHSSNIGAARIGLKLGKKKYYEEISRFGFKKRTGICLPVEEKGILRHPDKWSQVSIAFIAHGYEIAVTPIQMITAFNVLANHGYMVQPSIIKNIAAGSPTAKIRKKLLSPGTVMRITSIMTEVVNRGTATKAKIEGIDIAGKTGTAKKMINGKYQRAYISSFGGFFPAQNPQITMFVLIDEPKGSYYGGDVAAPLYKVISEKLLIYLNIFPELDNNNEIKL
jgi:cell division protein FtsI (penicillin-binding protein 3)